MRHGLALARLVGSCAPPRVAAAIVETVVTIIGAQAIRRVSENRTVIRHIEDELTFGHDLSDLREKRLLIRIELDMVTRDLIMVCPEVLLLNLPQRGIHLEPVKFNG